MITDVKDTNNALMAERFNFTDGKDEGEKTDKDIVVSRTLHLRQLFKTIIRMCWNVLQTEV